AEGIGVVVAGAGDRQRRALGERAGYLHVEAIGVVRVHRRGHVVPVVAQGGLDLVVGGEDHGGRLRHEVQRRLKRIDRDYVGEIGQFSALPRLGGGHLRQLAVLRRQLRRRRQLDP